jgi:hypothetical protein
MLCVVAVVVAAASPAAGQDPRVGKVLADWKARQEAVDAARYVVKVKLITPAAARTDDRGNPQPGADDLVRDRAQVFHVNLATGQYREEIRGSTYNPADGRSYPSYTIETFDGQKVWSATPRAENSTPERPMSKNRPDLFEVVGDFRRNPFGAGLGPFFYGHGIVGVHDDTIYPGHFRREYNPDLFVFHAEAVHDGRRCVVIRTRPEQAGSNTFVTEFWTDPSRGSAILRCVILRDDEPYYTFRVDQQQTPHGWFPKRWEHVSFNRGRKVGSIDRYEVESLEFGRPPAEEELRFEVRPGMLVSRITHQPVGGNETPAEQERGTDLEYFRADDGGRLRPVDHPSSTKKAGLGLSPGRSPWILAAAVAGVAAVGLAAWRVRRSRRTPT